MDKIDRFAAWNTILLGTTPLGRLTSKGFPHRMVAELAADDLAPHREVEPTRPPAGVFDGAALRTFAQYAEAAILANATPDHGRKKETVPDEAMRYLRGLPILDWCTGLSDGIGELVGATFIHYDAGDAKLHVDNDGAYDFTLLGCLARVIPEGKRGSRTYFMLGNEVTQVHNLMPGDAVFFHSKYTPHGRTPLDDGERVVLLHLQFAGGHRAAGPDAGSTTAAAAGG
jgi:hypothetical protein